VCAAIKSDLGLSVELIVGAAVGGVFFLAAVGVWWFWGPRSSNGVSGIVKNVASIKL
jgi:hypothetical protein